MYLAINKQDNNEAHSFTWTENDKLIINNQIVNTNNWEIVEVEILNDKK